MPRSSTIKRLVVVTGDHTKPDSTKLGSAWGPQDLEAHQRMVEALESLGRFDISVIDDVFGADAAKDVFLVHLDALELELLE